MVSQLPHHHPHRRLLTRLLFFQQAVQLTTYPPWVEGEGEADHLEAEVEEDLLLHRMVEEVVGLEVADPLPQ